MQAAIRKILTTNKFSRTFCSQNPIDILPKYAKSMRWVHWLMGGLMFGSIGTVKAAQWTEDKEKKAKYMHLHKSLALIVLAALPIRIGLRFTSKLPPHLPYANSFQRIASDVTHYGLYGCFTILPISGVIMGYYGGKGLPFFSYHIDGAEQTNPQIAKQAFQIHKLTGQAFTYLVPLHVGAAGYHLARGQPIFYRMNPFA